MGLSRWRAGIVRGLRASPLWLFALACFARESPAALAPPPPPPPPAGGAIGAPGPSGEAGAVVPATRFGAAAIAALSSREAAPEAAPAPGSGRAYRFSLDNGVDVPGHPNAWAYVPRAFDPRRKLHVAVLFHGFHNCIDSYVSPRGAPCRPGYFARTGYDVARQVEESGTAAIVVVPELAFDAPSSAPGPLGEPGGLRSFLAELVEEALAPAIGARAFDDVERVALIASSGGYEALAPALAVGDVDAVRDVYLLDAMYLQTPAVLPFVEAHAADFAPDAAAPVRFGVLYSDGSGTARNAEECAASLARSLVARGLGAYVAVDRRDGDPTRDDLRVPLWMYRTRVAHDVVVRRYLADVLATSGI